MRYLIDSFAVLLDRRLSEHGHDLGDTSVTDPDLGAVEDEVLAVGRQHRAGPETRARYAVRVF